jgi:GNAT superfamily N-acetyltransferase
VRALGLRPRQTDSWWLCPTPAPNIYHTAITLRPSTDIVDRDAMLLDLRDHLDDPDSGYVSVCDSWDELPLHHLGLTRRSEGPWFVRPPSALPEAAPGADGLAIEIVRTAEALAEFEATVITGFGARRPIAPFDIHAPGVLTDPAMRLLLGRAMASQAGVAAGDPVAVSMAFVGAGLLGVYGVATVPAARRHGFAAAMTTAACAFAPELAAMLQPSAAALNIYRRLGFTDAGWFSHWT